MSATVAIAASSIALTAARRADCAASVTGYAHDLASVAARQEYAGCIQLLHPSDLSSGWTIVFKAMIVLVFLATLYGAWRGHQRYDGVALGALFGAVGGAALCMAALLVIRAARFLVS